MLLKTFITSGVLLEAVSLITGSAGNGLLGKFRSKIIRDVFFSRVGGRKKFGIKDLSKTRCGCIGVRFLRF